MGDDNDEIVCVGYGSAWYLLPLSLSLHSNSLLILCFVSVSLITLTALSDRSIACLFHRLLAACSSYCIQEEHNLFSLS